MKDVKKRNGLDLGLGELRFGGIVGGAVLVCCVCRCLTTTVVWCVVETLSRLLQHRNCK